MPNNSKYWTASLLKRRGWTNEQMRVLLPKPRYIRTPSTPQGMRVWDRADVLRAERSPEFTRRGGTGGRNLSAKSPAPDAAAAAAVLEEAWEAAERDNSPA